MIGAGGGLNGMDSYVALTEEERDEYAVVEDLTVFPFGHVALDYRLSPRWRLNVSGEGITLGKEWSFNAWANLIYRAARAWDFGLSYSYFSRKIETDELLSETDYNVLQVSVSRYW
jgi:hypothetical protein